MSLYVEAGKIVEKHLNQQYPIKTLCYNSKYEEKKPLLALVSKTIEKILVIEKTLILINKETKKNLLKLFSKGLLYVLIYEQFFSKGGIRNKEFGIKLKPYIKELKKIIEIIVDIKCQSKVKKMIKIENINDIKNNFKCCIRVNLLKITIEKFIEEMENKYKFKYFKNENQVLKYILELKKIDLKLIFYQDVDFDTLFHFCNGSDFHLNELYINSCLIIQSKVFL